jgi:hypothetical protein
MDDGVKVTDGFVDINDYDPDSLERTMKESSKYKSAHDDTVTLDASKIAEGLPKPRVEVAEDASVDWQSTKTGQRRHSDGKRLDGMVATPRYDGNAAVRAEARMMFRTPPYALEAVCESIPDDQLPSQTGVDPADDTAYMKHEDPYALTEEPAPTVRVLRRESTKVARFEP